MKASLSNAWIVDRWLEIVLAERFGNVWRLSRDVDGLYLKLEGAEGFILFDKVCDNFFEMFTGFHCAYWSAEAEGWFAILGGSLPAPGVSCLISPLIEKRHASYVVHYDLLGFVYWMLVRIEELGCTDLDDHQRFPASSSHAYKYGYLDRPIVDEWLDILGQVIKAQWPGVKLLKHNFRTHVSHDVDHPMRYGFASVKNLILRMASDSVRGDIMKAIAAPWVRINTVAKLHPLDPFNTFDWIMDQSEYYGLTSSFYFICGHTSTLDGEYDIEHPAIRDLLKRIHKRGHEIGLHPSYNTYANPELLYIEAKKLQKVCFQEGVRQSNWGGRMHYLRWKHPSTLRALVDAGMDYDGTLGYADHTGFRCGTCFEYPGFDPIENQMLPIRIRPLIAMEVSVLNRKYMNHNENDALFILKDLKRKCEKLNGIFSLLWHNSELIVLKDLYCKLLSL